RDSRVAFHPDGDLLAAGCNGQQVRLWSLKSGKEVALLTGHDDAVRDVAFSPDGRWLATAGEAGDRTIRIWDLTTNSEVHALKGHTDCVYAIRFSGDGNWLASGSVDGTVRLWDTSTWDSVAELQHGPKVYDVAFNKDNSR